MIDSLLDYAVDNSAAFGIMLVVSVIVTSATSIWIVARLHERFVRRRGNRLIG